MSCFRGRQLFAMFTANSLRTSAFSSVVQRFWILFSEQFTKPYKYASRTNEPNFVPVWQITVLLPVTANAFRPPRDVQGHLLFHKSKANV